MDKYEELKLETTKRREKIVDKISFVSIWVWIFIWWLIWDIEILTSHINIVLSIFIFSIIALVGCYTIMGISYWVRSNVGKTIK
jgi:uncharacterized membrane protein